MSIINDALKKTEYLKKLKNISRQAFSTTQAASSTISVQSVEKLQPKEFGPQIVPPETVSPHRNIFNILNVPSQLSISRIVLIIFIASGSLLLLFGPWFYMWSGDQVSHLRNTKVIEVSANQTAMEMGTSMPPAAQPVTIVEAKPAPSQSFRKYRGTNVKPSVRPVPKMVHTAEKETVYHLTGISVINDNERFIVLNGKVLGIGERLGDAKVTSIRNNEVVLKRGDKEITLFLE